jgi:carboxyl-terminal processing protease
MSIRSERLRVKTQSAVFRIVLAGFTGLLLACLSFSSGFVVASFQPSQKDLTVPVGILKTEPTVPVVLGIFEEAWDLIERDFFGPLPPNTERVYGAIKGLLETLDDPYTVLVEPIPHQFEQDDLRGSYGGVGLTLSPNAEGEVVLSPFRDSPASRAGIQDGDVLVAIDAMLVTREMDISQDLAANIRGEIGTDVTLTIRRGDKTLTFTVTREVIETPSVLWRMLEQAPTLGYIQITSFTDRTPSELVEGLDVLLADGAEALILDLRDNGGGLLQASIDVVDQFLDGGVVLYENRKNQDERLYIANRGGHALDIPLAVLVNHGTASAAEIVAGAIQDHERGILVGEPTFGKGSVQLIFGLSDGASLHVTAARWYTPDRHQIDGVGLRPNLMVEAKPDGEADLLLQRAIELLISEK